jgi:putative ABC transport system permease protein
MFLSYCARNLVARFGTVAQALGSIAVSIAAAIFLLSALAGLTATITNSGSPRNVTVLVEDSEENASQVPITVVDTLGALPGIARRGDVQQMSAELVMDVRYRNPSGTADAIQVRGVDPAAFEVHPVTVEGQGLTRGKPGVLVGARRAAEQGLFAPDGLVRIARERWPIVGILHAPGTLFESELWCDRAALTATLREPYASVVSATLRSPADAPGFADAARKIRSPRLIALTEPTFFRARLAKFIPYVRMIESALGLIILASVLASISSVYTVFRSRVRELATLIAIGYTRRRVAVIMCIESALLSAGGLAVGLLVLPFVYQRELSYEAFEVSFRCRVTVSVLVTTFGIAGAIAFCTSVIAALLVFRLPVLRGLRD